MMKSKLISHYIILFLVSILFFTLTTTYLLNTSILKEKYMINIIDNEDYYDALYVDIREEMLDNIPYSGLEDSILDDLFDEEDLKRDTLNIVKSFYENKEIVLVTSNINEKLHTNIDNYLKEKNLTVSDTSSIDKYVDNMIDIYKSNLIPSDILTKGENIFNKVTKLVKIAFILLLILYIIIIVIFIIKKKSIKDILSIPLAFTSFTLLYIHFYIMNHLDIANLIIYNESLSDIIKVILNNLLNYIKVTSIILLVISILVQIIFSLKNRME